MRRILFVIPTRYRDPEKLRKSADALSKQMSSDDSFYIIANQRSFLFELDTFPANSTPIVHVPAAPSVPASLNYFFDKLEDFRYFCYVHDDLCVYDEDWIDRCIAICADPARLCGEIGVVGHTSSNPRPVPGYPGLDRVLWADGIYFLRTDVMRANGLFDLRFTQDCAEEDYARRLDAAGRRNYWLRARIWHSQTAFHDKAPMEEVLRCRMLLKSKWP